MVRKKRAGSVGSKEAIQKLISNDLHNLIRNYQKELQIKEINKFGSRAQKITYVYASYKLSKKVRRALR